MPRARRIPESAATSMSIRRYLATPVDAWHFPPQWTCPVYPGFSDAERAWFARPVEGK